MIAIISDVHGNLSALESALAEIDHFNPTRVVCLGDIAGYYSSINEVCELLREHGVESIMGNHDNYLTTTGVCPRSQSATECLAYQLTVIKTTHLKWLRDLPLCRLIDDQLNIVHGGWNDPLEEYLLPTPGYFADFPGVAFSSGHTHIPLLWSDGAIQYCNPGSVGQPRDGDPRASFAMWDGCKFAVHRVEYDIERTKRGMTRAGFSPYFSDNLSFGLRIGAEPIQPDNN